MPLYLITIKASGDPLRHVTRAVQAVNVQAAEDIAIRRLDYARSIPQLNTGYDTWVVRGKRPGSSGAVVLATGDYRE